MIDDLEFIIKENKQILSSPEFARHLMEQMPELVVNVKSDNLHKTYRSLIEINGSDKFLSDGETVIQRRISSGGEMFSLKPHISKFLRGYIERARVPVPSWLPDACVVDDVGDDGKPSYFFVLTTIDLSTLHNQCLTQITALARNYIQEKKSLRPELDGQIQTEPKNFKWTEEQVSENVFLAKKYLSLKQSAANRGMDFNLTIEELGELLKDRKCYFSGVDLVCYEHSPGDDLPDNYLTIDRLDNNKGYVSGNVVCCSKSMNIIKGQMSPDKFQDIVEMHNMMKSQNLDSQQLKAFKALLEIA
jgi:hypothetical protein